MGIDKVVIGTRKSQLAMAQTQLVVAALEKELNELQCEIRAMLTTGDKILDKPLLSFGGKGIFIEAFEAALQEQRIDIAVHSAKDMPAVLGKHLHIGATLQREDPRDVLIWRKGEQLEKKEGLIIGTGSKRREIQIQKLYPCECRLLRGNVNTRLSKLDAGEYDAIILAAAGLKRLGILQEEKYQFRFLDISEMVPSAGQGIIALETMQESDINKVLEQINDVETYYRLLVERYLLKKMNAGCHEPIGVYSEISDEKIRLYLMNGRGKEARYFSKEMPLLLDKDNSSVNCAAVQCYEKRLATLFAQIDKWLIEIGCVEKGSC